MPAPHMLVVPGGAAPALRAMADENLLAYLRGAAGHPELRDRLAARL